jgi:hypothetical protein
LILATLFLKTAYDAPTKAWKSKKAFKPIEPTFLPILIFISSVGITVGILGITQRLRFLNLMYYG